MNNLLRGHIKSIRECMGGYVINNKVFIDNSGILYNDDFNLKPYKKFPLYYFELRNKLITKPNLYSVYVGGLEVNDYFLSKSIAEKLAQDYLDDDYDDVQIVNIESED